MFDLLHTLGLALVAKKFYIQLRSFQQTQLAHFYRIEIQTCIRRLNLLNVRHQVALYHVNIGLSLSFCFNFLWQRFYVPFAFHEGVICCFCKPSLNFNSNKLFISNNFWFILHDHTYTNLSRILIRLTQTTMNRLIISQMLRTYFQHRLFCLCYLANLKVSPFKFFLYPHLSVSRHCESVLLYLM